MLVTYNGKVFDYNNINKDSIDLEDIFRSLPRLNRFVGHSSRAYNVAEHTFYCLLMAEKLGYTYREQFLTFIHDFTEPYVGDCPAPLKRLLPEYITIEAKVEQALYEHIGIRPPTDDEQIKIKRIDLTMLVIEMRDFTVHEYESFISDSTYNQFLDDEQFQLKDEKPLSEEKLRELITELYYYLLKKVTEEEESKNELV